MLQFLGNLAKVAAVGVSVGCLREAVQGQLEVALWEWNARISLPEPHAPGAGRVELKVSLRN